MPRPSSTEIDEEILETAAGLIAARGIEGTSLSQIADAVGYSKTGLLHRFPTKQTLIDAVLAACSRRLSAIAADLTGYPSGSARDVAVVTAVAHFAIVAPGHMSLALAAFTATPHDAEFEPVLAGLAGGLQEAFGDVDFLPRPNPPADVERAARKKAALATIAVLAPLAAGHAVTAGTDAAQSLLVTIALDALGVEPAAR